MKKSLITGGSGFIGYFLATSLSSEPNHTVVIIDNLSRGRLDDDYKALLKRPNITFIQGDLTEKETFDSLDKDFTYIYHFAAVIGVKNVLENPDKVLYTNAISTLLLFDYCKTLTQLKKVLFSSTSEISAGTLKHFNVVVPTPEDVPLTLLDIKGSRTTYALSKMYGESICFNYGKKYNIPVIVVRYFNIYGPRMGFQHVIPEMFIKLSQHGTIGVASPTHTRAFCYVDDAVAYTIAVAEHKDSNQDIVNIGNASQEIEVQELVQTIARVLGRDITITPLPDTPGSPTRRCPDTTRLLALTKTEPKVSLEEGISKTYAWYKDKLNDKYE